MFENLPLLERLKDVLEILQRIPRRIEDIKNPGDFLASNAGIDKMDAICMVLIAAGEEIKKIDNKTNGEILAKYPEIEWRGVMGVRDILAHGYLTSAETIFRA